MRVLHHPNIITLLEVIETSSMLCLVLEMCPVDVLSHLCEKGVMPEHTARRHGRELLAAFEYMHHRGVVHRDLKVSPITLLPFARSAPHPRTVLRPYRCGGGAGLVCARNAVVLSLFM